MSDIVGVLDFNRGFKDGRVFKHKLKYNLKNMAYLSNQYPTIMNRIYTLLFHVDYSGLLNQNDNGTINNITQISLDGIALYYRIYNSNYEIESENKIYLDRIDHKGEKHLLRSLSDILIGGSYLFPIYYVPTFLIGYNSYMIDLPILISKFSQYNMNTIKASSHNLFINISGLKRFAPIPIFQDNILMFHVDMIQTISSSILFRKEFSFNISSIVTVIDRDFDETLFTYEYLKLNQMKVILDYTLPLMIQTILFMNLPFSSVYQTDAQKLASYLSVKAGENNIKAINFLETEDYDFDNEDIDTARQYNSLGELIDLKLLLTKEQLDRFMMKKDTRFRGGLNGCLGCGTYFDVFHIDFRSHYPTIMLIIGN